jgi:proteic killer suppression protein
VKITFRDKRLRGLIENNRKLLKEFGLVRSKKLILRLTQLEDAMNLEEVRYLPGNYHELQHNRKGQWSCDLDQPYRLVFTPMEDPIPANENGQFIWIEITGVEILEIIDYH